MDKLLSLLSENPRLTNSQLSVMLDTTEEEVERRIADFEKNSVICGYSSVINWDKVPGSEKVTALIELKVTPRRDSGYEAVADEILSFPEVESMYLMSGGYDLAVYVTGKTFQDIAMFVATRLAPIDSVISTATHFMLKKYKENGVRLEGETPDERSPLF
ncbi:MAG: Lrp/AsnC family transcriptional regulator [Oscillospiraceae bacterium]|jgi:DNA-binding Lrp family transcriptional regulator|nr:Lrp/AsnC family transcriptional regulator [Oscillospiraceae bacterium]